MKRLLLCQEVEMTSLTIVIIVLGTLSLVHGDTSDNYEYYGYEPQWHSPNTQALTYGKPQESGLNPQNLGMVLALSVSHLILKQ